MNHYLLQFILFLKNYFFVLRLQICTILVLKIDLYIGYSRCFLFFFFVAEVVDCYDPLAIKAVGACFLVYKSITVTQVT